MTTEEIINEVVKDYEFLTASLTLIPYLRTSDTYTLGVFVGRMRRNHIEAVAIEEFCLADRICQTIEAAHSALGFGVKP